MANPSNRVIIGSNGFLKSIIFDKELLETKIEWSNTITEAMFLNKKQAENLVNKYNLTAFIWYPNKETNSNKNWIVKRRECEYNIYDEKQHNALEYLVFKQQNESELDCLNRLINGSRYERLTLEEANKLCDEKNRLMLTELIEKIELNNASR